MSKLKRDYMWMLGCRAMGMLASLVTGGMINRSLGADGRGVYAEMLTWIAMAVVVFGLSMNTAIYHFADRSKYPYGEKAKACVVGMVSAILAMVASAIFILAVKMRPEIFSIGSIRYVWPLMLLLMFQMIGGNLTVFVQAIGNVRLGGIVGMVQSLVQVGIILYGFSSSRIDIRYALWSLIVMQCLSLVIIGVKVLRMHGPFVSVPWRVQASMLTSGLKTHLGTLSTFAMMRLNQLIVFRYCGDKEAGYYAVSLQIAFALMFIPMAFQNALYPRVIHSQDDYYEVTQRSLRMMFYSWGAFCVGCIALAHPIMLAYGGNQFLTSVDSFRLLMLATWLLPMASLAAPYIIKKGAFYVFSVSGGLMAILSVGLNVILVPRYGGVGAASATVISCAACYALTLWFLRHLSGVTPDVVRFSLQDWRAIWKGRAFVVSVGSYN